MHTDLIEPITDKELHACPINEQIRVLDLYIALQILTMDVHGLSESFLTSMHKEMIHLMLQRATMAPKVLLSPNFCAELFTFDEFVESSRYIVNKLVGRRTSTGRLMDDFDGLQRQTQRKILKLSDGARKGYLIFFWGREPNLIREYKPGYWEFYPNSPAYKDLVDFYGKYKPVSRGS